MPLPWEEYRRRIMGFEGNPNSPGYYKPKWDVRQWTVGPGVRYRPGMDLSREGLERAFDEEIGQSRARVRQRFGDNLTPGQEAALSSLDYNAGPRFMNAGLGKAIDRGDWADAQRRLLQYTSADPRYQRGLLNRRTAEAGWLAPGSPGAGPLPEAMALGATPILGHEIQQAAAGGPAIPPPMPPVPTQVPGLVPGAGVEDYQTLY